MLLVLLAFAQCTAVRAQYRTIGYYPMWSRASLPAQAVQYEYLTHILHAFAWPLADGSLAFSEAVVDTGLINATHRAGRKILLSFGGAGTLQTVNFALVTADTAKRRAFVQNVVKHLSTYHYDGADIDWEGPQNASEKANEAALIRELRTACRAADSSLLITMAVGVTNWSGQWHDFAALKLSVDWFNAMTYDFHGSWSAHAGHNAPLYASSSDFCGSVDGGITYLHQTRGIPEGQLALGLPFYGRRFQTAALYGPKTEPTVDIFYADVLFDLSHGSLYVWDSASQAPYAMNSSGPYLDTFDDSTSLTIKCNYAKAHNLSGVTIWALGQDLSGGRQQLLEAVGQAMTTGPDAVKPDQEVIPHDYALLQNFPNPFNPETVVRYQLPEVNHVRLGVYDILGREVATLVNERQPAGTYQSRFNGSGLASGVYICRLIAGPFVRSQTMLLVR